MNLLRYEVSTFKTHPTKGRFTYKVSTDLEFIQAFASILEIWLNAKVLKQTHKKHKLANLKPF